MNFEQESETYFRHSAADCQKTGNRQLRSGLDWDGFHSYTQSEPSHVLFRKEVIQPQVLLRLPCYDFTPIMSHTLGRCLLAVSARTSSTTHFRDVTGGVYKARERIHGGVLIRHY